MEPKVLIKSTIDEDEFNERVRRLFADLRREMVPWQGQLGPNPPIAEPRPDSQPDLILEQAAALEVCPFLSTSWDPDLRFMDPSPENLCHKAPRPKPVDLQDQKRTCLGSTYAQCPVYQAAPPEKRAKKFITRLRKFL